MKVLFSLFPGKEKLFIILTALGALACAVLGCFFLNPDYRGAYCVTVAVIIILLIFIGVFGIKRIKQERELADKRKLLGWTAENERPVKDALYNYMANKLLLQQTIIGLAAVLFIILFAFMADSLGIILIMGIYLGVSAITFVLQLQRKKLFPPNEFALCDHELIHFGACVNINGLSAGIYSVMLDEEKSLLHTSLFIGNKTFDVSTQVPAAYMERTKAFIDDLNRHFEEIKREEEKSQ